MALTGDLHNIPIVDIIQLVHTTRKSGTCCVQSDKGECCLVFSGGYIVGASHVDDSIRIGSVLVKLGALALDDLKQTMSALKDAAGDNRLLLSALLQSGKLKQEDALKGLKKLVEVTIIELMSWTKGTFTFDSEAAVPEADEALEPGQEVVLDCQMVLMDALRVFDERERDRMSGKEVLSFEAIYPEVLPELRGAARKAVSAEITADVLGLADVDRLEKKIRRPVSELVAFDPVEIHRQKIRELLAGFSADEQEALVAYLKQAAERKPSPQSAAQQSGKAVVLFSNDKLFRHSLMTISQSDRIPVFATDDEQELERLIAKCFSAMRMPVVVFDRPAGPQAALSDEKLVPLRRRVQRRYPSVPLLQLAPLQDIDFALRSYDDGVRAVLPKPSQEVRKETYVQDTIKFLGAFLSTIKAFSFRSDTTERYVQELKKDIRSLREIATPSDAALVMLAAVAEMFERAVTFIVRPTELIGERGVGVIGDKSMGPAPADKLKVPLAPASVFREVLDKGTAFFGEGSDDTLTTLHQQIGKPLSPAVMLIPLVSDKKVVAVVYGDFGKKTPAPVQLDILEILSQQVGMALEYALYRRQVAKASQKA